jgi:hypothetical protein
MHQAGLKSWPGPQLAQQAILQRGLTDSPAKCTHEGGNIAVGARVGKLSLSLRAAMTEPACPDLVARAVDLFAQRRAHSGPIIRTTDWHWAGILSKLHGGIVSCGSEAWTKELHLLCVCRACMSKIEPGDPAACRARYRPDDHPIADMVVDNKIDAASVIMHSNLCMQVAAFAPPNGSVGRRDRRFALRHRSRSYEARGEPPRLR